MSTSRRRGPYRAAGVLEFVLSEPEILCAAIADGRHISPTLLRLLSRAKGVDGIALITDATAGAEANPTVAGNVGARVLRRYNLVLDYRHNIVRFEPPTR